MYTNPTIVKSQKLTTTVYIQFYFEDERTREYSGRCINQKIFPGKAKTVADRTSLLKLLCSQILLALQQGRYKQHDKVPPVIITTESGDFGAWDQLLPENRDTLLRMKLNILKHSQLDDYKIPVIFSKWSIRYGTVWSMAPKFPDVPPEAMVEIPNS